MSRIDYEAHARNEESSVICYANNKGGATISVFKPYLLMDRMPRHFNFSCDADFLNYADKIALLAEHVKRRNK